MRYLILLVCLAMVSCQQPGKVVEDMEVSLQKNNQLTANESDYLYVFDKMEAQLKSAPNRVTDNHLNGYVEDVLCTLSSEQCSQVRIYILEDPDFNAHMLPNGAFIILTGLLLRVETESQLAYVLAHELGHYVNKHGIKKINYSKLRNSSRPGKSPNRLSRLTNFISINRYTQHLEREADLYSIDLLIKNHYDLNSVAALLVNVQAENTAAKKQNKGGFNSSHPGTDERISLIRQYIVDTELGASARENIWQQIRQSFLDEWLLLELRKREFKSSLVLLNRLKSSSDDPRFFDYFIGEVYRKQIGRENQRLAIDYYLSHLSGDHLVNEAFKHLADVYVELDKVAFAKQFYLKYLELNPRPTDYDLVKHRLSRLR